MGRVRVYSYNIIYSYNTCAKDLIFVQVQVSSF